MDPVSRSVATGNERQGLGKPLAVLAGASGLVGASCAGALVGRFESVALVRRPLPAAPPELHTANIDFVSLPATRRSDVLASAGVKDREVTAGLCALGTTIKKAGSQAAFRAVDHDAVVGFAAWTRAAGANRFVVVSSVGADARSSNFYLRVKGEMEAALHALGFARLVILRPSFLKGDRSERRLGESIAGALFPLVEPLLAGGMRRYRSIDAATIARAMVAAAATDTPGAFIWEHDEIAKNGRAM
ncbi:MAG TPA: NAD(P)H-binding protein [Polyangia bacterium]